MKLSVVGRGGSGGTTCAPEDTAPGCVLASVTDIFA